MQLKSGSRTDEITRRVALAGALTIPAAAPVLAAQANGACRIGPAPHARGPLVFMNYDQIELDAAYDQRSYAPLGDQITARFITDSAETRRRLGNPQRVSYGPTDVEKLDIFRTARGNAPVMVFVHGGAWLRNRASDFHYMAENFVRGGAHFVALDFTPVDKANGDLRVMADQVRRGIIRVQRNAASFSGDPNRIFVSGQSSGAHLAAVALTTDWAKDYGAAPDILKGGVLQSGMYEMKPVRLSSRGSYVKFDDAMEEAMSPQRHIGNLRAPITVMYGTNETPEFQRQNREFAAAVKSAGKPATLIVLPNHNHYEVQQTMASPYGWGGRAALAAMGLGEA